MNTEILTSHLRSADIRVHPAEVFDRDSDWDWHIHEECETYLCIGGEKIFTADGREITPRSGEVLVIGSRVPHKILTRKGSEGILLQFADPTAREYRWLTVGTTSVRLFAADDPIGMRIAQSMREIQDEFLKREAAYEAFIVAHIAMIAAYLRRIEGQTQRLQPSQWHRMQPILEEMEKNCRQSLSLSQLAAQFGFAPSYFSSLFREAVGMTYTEVLLRMRLCRAQDLLMRGEDSIDRIAQDCGFSYSSYFIKQFKRIYACTPYRLRRTKQK